MFAVSFHHFCSSSLVPLDVKRSRAEDVPVVAFNKELAANVDEKLRQNLTAMELLPKSGMLPPDSREDDEICEMIRGLQRQLKDQVTANNAMKAELKPIVEKRRIAQQNEEKAKAEWNAVLKRYEDLLAQTKKKGAKE